MKAKIKASGRIIEVRKMGKQYSGIYYNDDEYYEGSELDFNIYDSQESTIIGCIARDKNGSLYIYNDTPERNEDLDMRRRYGDMMSIPEQSFPGITWESGPREVEITIKIKE